MSEEDAGEKTEEPTERRREEFRERGQIAKS
jgi:flagellar biosynthesis protein FlhB